MAESEERHLGEDGKFCIEYICEMCEKTSSAGNCSGCECYICQSCFDNHVKVRKNHHHVLQLAPESKEDDYTIHFKTCTEHTQQEVRLYCTDHKCCGCGECMLFNHKSCKYKYITEASKDFQDSGELARFLEDIQDIENIHEKCVKSVASQSERSDNIDKNSTIDVQQFVKDVISYVTDEEKRVINKAVSKKSVHDEKIEKLSGDLQRIGTDITSISSNVKKEDNIHKLFILAVEAKPKLRQIRDKLASIDGQEVIDKYTFHPDKLLQRRLSEKRPLGNLSYHIQSEEDDEEDYESKYKAECLDTQRFKQQLSVQEQETKRLEQQLSTQQQENQCLKQQMSTKEQQLKQQLSTQEQQLKQMSTQEKQLKQQLSKQEQQCMIN